MGFGPIEGGSSGGGGGAVDSVNGQTGVVVLTKSNIGLGNADNTSDVNKPVSTAQAAADSAVQAFSIQRANHTGVQAASTINGGTFNSLAGFDGSGVLESAPGYGISKTTGGLSLNFTPEPNSATGTDPVHSINLSVEPLANSPNDTINAINISVNHDPNSSGFTFGTNGTAYRTLSSAYFHDGTGNLGEINFIANNFDIGNGTDPVDLNGVSYSYGFGTINANVNISGPMQGYGFQPNVNASATIGTSEYITAFYDSANIGCASPGYTSIGANPTIASINNNNNYNGISNSPNITTFTGNAGFIGYNCSPTLGTFNNGGYFQGVGVNPTITSARYAAGLNVTMDNVTPYAGVSSSIVVQDLTFEFILPGSFNDSYTMAFINDGTAGAETVTIAGFVIEVHMQSGVSTATQIKAACDANGSFASNITTTISGVGGNAQVAVAAAAFAGGVDAGRVLAAYLDGDVEITGGLTFGGALSIGKLTAFHSQALTDGGGTPSSIHSLITSPTVAANATLTSADTISVNTAALINIGDNATVGTTFIGVAALGLPAVLTMGAGSTLDRCYASLFAISLDAAAGGGTVDEMATCRGVAIPNGVTTVNNLYGFLFDLPFGDPGTKTFGFYDRPGKNNYLAGQLLIGGTAGSDDVVTNSSIALEIKSTTKAFMNARMTTAERNALTAVNGMQVYNSTTDKLQVYAGGSWVDLH